MAQASDTQSAAPADRTRKHASLLASGERVLVVRQRHWFTFIQAARWFVLVLVVGVLVGVLGRQVPTTTGSSGSSTRSSNWGFWLFVLDRRSRASAGTTSSGGASATSSRRGA